MPRLLDPLTPDQQRLIDLVADAFVTDVGQWPYFDYLEGEFDKERKDAWEVLYSLPRVGQWRYGSAWWVGNNQAFRPGPEQEIELTIVGMQHSGQMRRYVKVFFYVLEAMVDIRRAGPVARRAARKVSLSSEDLVGLLIEGERVPLSRSALRIIPTLLAREPATFGSGTSIEPDGSWTKLVPRSVFEYEGVKTIEAYVDRLEALTTVPTVPPNEGAPSPLGLTAALDYLDMAWRVVYKRPLFSYPSAQRLAKLTYAANTAEEFDSRLTALGEILRTANSEARSATSTKLTAASHDHPLAPLRDFMGTAASDRQRIDAAIDALEAALSVRDAAQHTEAGGRAVQALGLLGIQHPVGDYAVAWQVISSRVVTALDNLRETMSADAGI